MGLHGGFLESQPRAVFESAIGRLDRPMQDFFRRRERSIYSQYLAQLAGEPTLRFAEFLNPKPFTSTRKPFPFKQEFFGASPRQRGSFPNILTPPARFLNF